MFRHVKPYTVWSIKPIKPLSIDCWFKVAANKVGLDMVGSLRGRASLESSRLFDLSSPEPLEVLERSWNREIAWNSACFFRTKRIKFWRKKGDFKKRKNFTLWLYAYLQGFPHCDLRSGLLHWTSTLQRAAGCGMRNASGRKSMRCRVPNRNACAISLEAMHVCFHGFTWCLWRNASWTSWCLIWCYMMFSWFQLVHSQSKSMPSMQPKEKYQVPDVTTFNLPGSGGGSGKSPGELRTSKLLRFALHWNHWWKTKIVPLRHLSRPFPTFRSRKNRRVIPG